MNSRYLVNKLELFKDKEIIEVNSKNKVKKNALSNQNKVNTKTKTFDFFIVFMYVCSLFQLQFKFCLSQNENKQ